jgi:hypothetical protein
MSRYRIVRALRILAFILLMPGLAAAQDTPIKPDAAELPADTKETTAAKLEPKPEQERPSVWGEPTEVKVGIYVIDVDGIDSANQRFSASVYYEAHWINPLLRHEGPGPVIRRATDVWTPRLTIVNQQQAWTAFPDFVEITPEGRVTLRQKTWGWFSQPLDLADFPMDRQVLTIHLVAAGLSARHVAMLPELREGGKKSGIASKFSMPDFNILAWDAEPRPYVAFEKTAGSAGFVMAIEAQRVPTYYFWKVIFPLCLIVIMSWIPRWLDPKESATGIGISTTAFLTLVAYLFAITVLLPRVSYLTRMDKFILLATVLVFTALIQTVAHAYLVDRKKIEMVRWANIASRIVYPVALLAVLGASFF